MPKIKTQGALAGSGGKGTVGYEDGGETQKVVPAAGVEPATFRSGGERSNPLSYAGILIWAEKIAFR